ncbi:AI-2E family transporter [Eubacteriaceae bacterium ES3]|nr:AI-2E family transporter [Eubacteriaceae bacterium ES3]
MKFFQESELFRKYLPLFLGAVGLMLIYKFLDNVSFVVEGINGFFSSTLEVLMPIIIGVVVAYLLFKPMHGIEKFVFKRFEKTEKKPKLVRLLAIFVVYAITLILFVLFFSAVIPSIVESLSNLIIQMPEFLEIINNFLGDSISQGGVTQELFENLQDAVYYLQNMDTYDMLNFLTTSLGITSYSFQAIGNAAFLVIKGTFGFVASFFIVFFIGLYTMLDKEKILEQVGRFFRALMSRKVYNSCEWAVTTIDSIFYKYFSGKLFTSLLIGLLFYLGLLVIDVQYAPLFAVIVGVLNMIPYFGPILGAIPAILITLIDDPVKALWVGVLILIVQQFDGNVLAPSVLGKIVELNPFWVLVSVVVGGSLFGLLGMFIAIPMFAVIKVFLEKWLQRFEEKKERELLNE